MASVAPVGSARLVIFLFPIFKSPVIELVPALCKYLLSAHPIVTASLEKLYPVCIRPVSAILAA